MYFNGRKLAAQAAVGIICLMGALIADANAPALVLDINTQPIGMSSNPTFLGTSNGWTYFAATDGTHGVELWKTDGTTAGTSLVKDIEPGSGSSNPTNFVSVGAVAYFTATTQASGTKIWLTDGTADGTRQVSNLPTGTVDFTPAVVGTVGSKVIIASSDGASGGTTGIYLWATDGTASGTVQLAGIDFTPRTHPNGFAAATNGKAYFTGFDNVHGVQPWVTDGSVAGTHILTILPTLPGTSGSDPASFVQVGNYVYFTASDNPGFDELYRIRLTDDGVEQVTSNLIIEDYSTGDLPLIPLGNGLVFIAKSAGVEQVWFSDGTAVGTIPLTSYGSQNGNSYLPPRFTVVGNHAVFAAAPPNSPLAVLSTDGTVGGTVNLSSAPVPVGSPSIPLASLGAAGSFAYYGSPMTGVIFRTDGTLAGTRAISTPANTSGVVNLAGDPSAVYFKLVGSTAQGVTAEYWAVRYDPVSDASTLLQRTPIPPGQPVQAGNFFALSGGHLYFDVNSSTRGLEPWVSDGTINGTQLLADIAPETSNGGSNPNSFFAFRGQLYFSANDGLSGQELWTSDGTAAGTGMAADLVSGPNGSSPTGFFAAGNSLIFFAYNGSSATPYLWSFDPASGQAQNFPSISGPYTCSTFTTAVASGFTFFPAYGDGVEPWRTDGTVGGTIEVADIAQGAGSSNPCTFIAMGGKAYFIAQQFGSATGYAVFSSDGSSAGAQRLAALGTSNTGSAYFLTTYAGALYFSGVDNSNQMMLWKSDGTTPGTTAITPLPSTIGSFIGVVNDRLLFSGPTGSSPSFWVFDTTMSAFSAIPGIAIYGAGSLTGNGALAFFTGYDQAHGIGPWVTDGTVAGTLPVVTTQGFYGNGVQWLGDFHNRAIYVTSDSNNAFSYWESDGTAAGTVSLGPLLAGQSIAPSGPLSATVDNKFFFAVADPTIGTELYVLLADAPFVPTSTTLTVSMQSATTGASVAFAVTVKPSSGAGVPTGAMVIADGTTQLQVVPLDGTGAATFTTTTLAVGVHSISAAYGGDQRYMSSSASAVTVTITSPPPTITLNESAASVVVGKPMTLTWSSTNATSCTANGDWSGAQPVMGAQIEYPSAAGTLNYTLTCAGTGGTATSTQKLTVTAATSGGGGGGVTGSELLALLCLLSLRTRLVQCRDVERCWR